MELIGVSGLIETNEFMVMLWGIYCDLMGIFMGFLLWFNGF
jgi:hypothetical protein